MNLKDFIHMDGYASYVWSSYALTLAVLAANAWWARHNLREALHSVRKRMQSQQEQGPA